MGGREDIVVDLPRLAHRSGRRKPVKSKGSEGNGMK
jgi:hypothetical protein